MQVKRFEDAMKRLEEIVKSLESGDLPLEESLKVFAEGMELAKYCSKKLEEAEKKVTVLIEEGAGRYTQVPFDAVEEKET
jgi:exodeoxyribonuclease VII small subunit